MNQHSMRKMLSSIGCIVLIAVMALSFTGCGGSSTTQTTATVASETKAFIFEVIALDGSKTSFTITSGKETVGEALLDEGLIEGYEGEYGLYVISVNGIVADWDKDQTYWAFYVDGDYGLTGVDTTEITEGTAYSFVLTKG